jgi:recombinational DNA repair protein (RecF pathway)
MHVIEREMDREMPELELALLRRSVAGLADDCERCGSCHRTLLVGERVYEYASGRAVCALCRNRERAVPADTHTVHGPEFGHTIRVLDRRGARQSA